jgi:hypothetical protein
MARAIAQNLNPEEMFSTHHHLVHDDSHSPPVHGSSVVIVLQHLPEDFILKGSVADPDPLIRGTDPAPEQDPSIIKQNKIEI